MSSDDVASGPTQLASQAPEMETDSRPSVPDGYLHRGMLGRGGMGEVLLAEDPDIGRDIAIKRMRAGLPAKEEARFLREAHIQARLEHPAIVPVHEIGRDAEGRPFFTMKRLAGKTLADVLPTLKQQSLLRIFVEVCQAIDFAHAQKIVHRDLKPSNIMVGDYGEVYVLDWGVARVLGEEDIGPTLGLTDSGQTEAGALLGTPGYMAPEQARSEAIGPAADVYALGAILFEILAGEPLHPRGVSAIANTIQCPSRPPTSVQPNTPPELCNTTTDALSAEAKDRPTAKELAARVQRYLDGDRDTERRRARAVEQLATARTALAGNDRALAMRHGGRALALDPDSREAAEFVSALILEPPKIYPPELAEHLAAQEIGMERQQLKQVTPAYVAFFLALPLVLMAGMRQPVLTIVFYGMIAIILGLVIWWRRRGRPRIVPFMILSLSAFVLMSRLFGPFLVLPGILAITGFGFGAYPTNILRPMRPVLFIVGAYAVMLVLELAGVFGTTTRFAGNALVTESAFIDLQSVAGKGLVLMANVGIVLLATVFAQSVSAVRWSANRDLEIQAWHLRKLVSAS